MVKNVEFQKVLADFREKIDPITFNNMARAHGRGLGAGRDAEVVEKMRKEFELHIRRFGKIIKR